MQFVRLEVVATPTGILETAGICPDDVSFVAPNGHDDNTCCVQMKADGHHFHAKGNADDVMRRLETGNDSQLSSMQIKLDLRDEEIRILKAKLDRAIKWGRHNDDSLQLIELIMKD